MSTFPNFDFAKPQNTDNRMVCAKRRQKKKNGLC